MSNVICITGPTIYERAVAPGGLVCRKSAVVGRENHATYMFAGRLPLSVRVPGAWCLSEDRLTMMAQRVATALKRGETCDRRIDASLQIKRAKQTRRGHIEALEMGIEAMHERELAKTLSVLAKMHEDNLQAA